MSDEKEKPPPAPPVIEGTPARPDIAAPMLDSLGRSMANKRGRKPGPQAPRDTAQVLTKELKARMPEHGSMSDDAVGKAIAGAFGAIGIFGGPHWRLLPTEQMEYGLTFGPLARMFGPEKLAQWIMVLMALPLVTSTVMPRVAIQSMIQKGELVKAEGRKTLIHIKTMMYAENSLDIEKQVLEGAAEASSYLRAQVEMARSVTTEMSTAQAVKDDIAAPVAQPINLDIPGDPLG